MPTVSVNRTELYYEDHGVGKPILFVHGMCGNANVWDEQVRRLAPDFRCITYDRRGHTRSPLGADVQRSVQLHANDAAALIDALGLAPCLLVGSSGGARVGLDVVRRYPHLLAGAVLSEPPLLDLEPRLAQAMLAALQPRVEQAVAERGPAAAVDAFFDYMCPGLWRAIDESKRNVYRANLDELWGDLRMPSYAVSPADLRAIKVPSLVISGDSSLPLLRQVAQDLADHIPGAEPRQFPSCGHVTYFEQPALFETAVRDWCRSGPVMTRAASGAGLQPA